MMKKALIILIVAAAGSSVLHGGGSYTIFESTGLVMDNSTGLYWTRCSISINGIPSDGINCQGHIQRYRWNDAITSCSRLNFAGRNNWRLPNIKELHSIAKYNETTFDIVGFNEQVFPGTMLNHYWSSTTHKNNPNMAWTIDFHYGNVTFQERVIPASSIENEFYVRCVSGPE